MKYWSMIFPKLPAHAMALYPFMLFKDEKLKQNAVIVRHEKIHFRQQIELLILPFYLIYVLHYLLNLLKYKNRSQAYLNICFEREAYANDCDINYLKTRKPYAWCRKAH